MFGVNTKPKEWPEEKGVKNRHMWIHGPSNCGKTSWVKQNYSFDTVYQVPYTFPENWCTYKGEKVLWLDEFKGQFTI